MHLNIFLFVNLSHILTILRKNPLLFPENKPEPTSEIAKKIGLQYFSTPESHLPCRKDIYSQLLTNINLENQKVSLPFMVQMGGNVQVNNSQQLRKLFESLFRKLFDAGKEMNENDKQMIFDAIEQVTKLEVGLNKLISDIDVYSNLNKMLQNSNTVEQVGIKDIKDVTDNRDKVNTMLNDINKKIN